MYCEHEPTGASVVPSCLQEGCARIARAGWDQEIEEMRRGSGATTNAARSASLLAPSSLPRVILLPQSHHRIRSKSRLRSRQREPWCVLLSLVGNAEVFRRIRPVSTACCQDESRSRSLL